MAKPFFEQSGNGFHAHYSLWKGGKNAFADKGEINDIGKSFIAGLQKRMAETAVCGSTTVNGFRRRQPYTFCPINTSWGIDNRTVGLRVIQGSDSAVVLKSVMQARIVTHISCLRLTLQQVWTVSNKA